MADRKVIQLTPEDIARIRTQLAVLGITYDEFVRFSIRQALDELEGYERDIQAQRAFYAQLNAQSKVAAERRAAFHRETMRRQVTVAELWEEDRYDEAEG